MSHSRSSTAQSKFMAAPESAMTCRSPQCTAGIAPCASLMYGWHRAMRIFDGPDEVHLRAIAKSELRKTVKG